MKKILNIIALTGFCSAASAQGKNQITEAIPVTNILYFLKIDNTTVVFASITLVVVLVVGYLVYRFFKSTEEKKSDFVPVIKQVFPNPSHGPVTIQIQGKASQLKVFNMNRQPLGSFAVTGGDIHFDLSKMPRGHYVVVAYYGATQSNAVQFTLQ